MIYKYLQLNRGLGLEIDQLKLEMNKLQKLVLLHMGESSKQAFVINELNPDKEQNEGFIYYSGQYRNDKIKYKWEAQEQQISSLLNIDGDKMARVLSALGNKPDPDLFRTGFSLLALQERVKEIKVAYPRLDIHVIPNY